MLHESYSHCVIVLQFNNNISLQWKQYVKYIMFFTYPQP